MVAGCVDPQYKQHKGEERKSSSCSDQVDLWFCPRCISTLCSKPDFSTIDQDWAINESSDQSRPIKIQLWSVPSYNLLMDIPLCGNLDNLPYLDST